MSVTRHELVSYLHAVLDVASIADYCPNGLQVEGSASISKIALAVTASLHAVQQACLMQADALLVHHGYFWKGEAPEITGMKAGRLRALLNHNVNLFAYHLPLDIHREYGNNIMLAKQCQWQIEDSISVDGIANLLWVGRLQEPMSLDAFRDDMKLSLGRAPLCIKGHDRNIERIAWCTGAAQKYLSNSHALKVDAFVSGEISENTTYTARELGINYLAAGHHATERYGVQALGQHLTEQFGLECVYVEDENPV